MQKGDEKAAGVKSKPGEKAFLLRNWRHFKIMILNLLGNVLVVPGKVFLR
jgi:hypothetical protein